MTKTESLRMSAVDVRVVIHGCSMGLVRDNVQNLEAEIPADMNLQEDVNPSLLLCRDLHYSE